MIPRLCVLLSLAAAPARAQLIFSPNGDGVKDQVTFKLSLPADAGISSWTLEIREQPTGKAQQGGLVKSFSGKGLPPKEIKWDGKDLGNRLVRDATYLYNLTLVTPAGNQVGVAPSPLIVDRVPPSASASVNPSLFSPNGDGVKDETQFALSADDASGVYGWLLTIKDKEGAPARSLRGKGAPPAVVRWDGRGDFEEDVPDGTYAFELTADDLAGNRVVTPSQKVTVNRAGLVSTVEVVPLLISPNGDGFKDEVIFKLASGSAESVERWELKIMSSNGRVVHSFTGLKDPPARVVWNGIADGKKPVPDGSYQVQLSETDKAGNTSSTTPQPLEIDTQPPLVEARVEPSLLSPNGDGVQDEAVFHLKGEDAHPFERWALNILNDVGKTVRSITGQPGSKPVAKVQWKGEGEGGKPLTDGNYGYVLEAVDVAGNRAVTPKASFRIDRVPPVLSAAVEPSLFSPNGDGVLDTAQFSLSAQDAGPIESWSLVLTDDKGKTVRTFTGPAERVPPTIPWDGRNQDRVPLPDGVYTFVLKAKDIAGNHTSTAEQKVTIGATRPTPTVSVDLRAISPNADNIKDVATFKLKAPSFNPIKEWSLRVLDKAKAARRTIQGRGEPPATVQWQGERDDRRQLPDDDYLFELETIDVAGNKVSTPPQPIRVDTTKPDLTVSVSPALFSPNGDGVKDEAVFIPGYKDASPIAKWKLILQDPSKNTVQVFSGDGAAPVSIPWKGKGQDGALLPDGPYTYVLYAEDDVGNKATTGEQILRLDNAAPKVSLSADPLLISPNADGVKDDTTFQLDYQDASDVASWKLVISQGPDKLSRTFSGLGRPPRSLRWDGRSDRGGPLPDGKHAAVLHVSDEVGLTGHSAGVEVTLDTAKPLVTVTAETDELQEMAVPMTVAENQKKDLVISLASEVLFDTGLGDIKAQAYPTLMKANHFIRRYPLRRVRIEGHADNVPISNEQFKNNVELSEWRAKEIMKFFVQKGQIDPARLSAKGYGDTRPKASNDTEEGRRLNRRVEIILINEK